MIIKNTGLMIKRAFLLPALFLFSAAGAGGGNVSAEGSGTAETAEKSTVGTGVITAENIERVAPDRVRGEVQEGKALLVCAYDDDKKYEKMNLEGSISYLALLDKLPVLPKETSIYFY